ncbi:MAG: RNA polymerase factor sigma-54, partial [Betaproteobacteria bacterium]|nr:RNA polymerase factor sigma-54 [Betaproteobacteria bacterium]
MKPTLQFRIAQQLTLTPQLQQAIRMLQMSSLELAQELEQALRDNPFLERSDESLDSFGSGDFQAAEEPQAFAMAVAISARASSVLMISISDKGSTRPDTWTT